MIRRCRRRAGLIVAILGLAAVVVGHHDVPAHMDMHGMTVGAACVAVLAASTAIAVGIGVRLLRPRTWWPRREWVPATAWISAPRSAPVRAGPPHLQLLVIRR
jgi:hypothetical protein